MAAEVEVRLLGQPSVTIDDRAVDALAAPRLLSLLAVLILHRTSPVLRQRAAFMLWPNSTEGQARTNLRQALHLLKRALPDASLHIDVDGAMLRWRPASPARVDVTILEDAASAAAEGADRVALERAVLAYRGELLPDAVDEWIEPIRTRLHQEHVGHLEHLSERCEAEGDVAAGVHWCQELLFVDPFHEPTYRRLMRLHGPADRARSVRTFHACAAALERDLGVAPSPDTVALYERIIASPTTPERVETLVSTAPLIGRSRERAQLIDTVRDAAAGGARVVVVRGEPGIGKSRLVADVVAWCERQAIDTVTTRAYEAEGRLALAPIAEVLRAPPVRVAVDRVDDAWKDELARIVPDLVTGRTFHPPTPTSDGSDRTRLFTAVAEVIGSLQRPLVFALDDLQWCDVDTLELLHFVVRTVTRVPLVVLVTARDEGFAEGPLATFVDGLRSMDALDDLPLDPLGAPDAAVLVEAALGARTSEAMVRAVVDAAGGNPLFLVEMARAGVDPTTGSVSLPAKVQAVIDRRLAAISDGARNLVEAMAVLGRQADVELVTQLWPADAAALADALDELWRQRILIEVGVDSYDFAHDRIRDVAYAGIGPARRRSLHRHVADSMANRSTAEIDRWASTIAAHYDRAGCIEVALDHYERAIVTASRVFAHDEVIALAQRALQLVGLRPDSPERLTRELAVLGPLAVATYCGPGITSDNHHVFDRVAELRRAGGPPLDPTILRVTANAAIGFRHFEESAQIGSEILALGQASGDPVLLTEGSYMCGVSSFWLGRLPESLAHLERSLASFDASRRDVHVERFGQDVQSVCLVRLAMTAWQLGHDERAAPLRRDALAAAMATGHPYTISYVRTFAAWAAADAGAADELDELLSNRPSTENRWVVLTMTAFDAWARMRDGVDDTGIAVLRTVIDESRKVNPITEPKALVLLADVLGRDGRMDEGLAAARQARAIAEHEMPILVADAWWAEAQLLHDAHAPWIEVGTAIDNTLSVARHQGAVMAERRARAAATAWLVGR